MEVRPRPSLHTSAAQFPIVDGNSLSVTPLEAIADEAISTSDSPWRAGVTIDEVAVNDCSTSWVRSYLRPAVNPAKCRSRGPGSVRPLLH
jgi:hypothetical protein